MARLKVKQSKQQSGTILVSGTSQTRSLTKPKPLPVNVLTENVNVFLGQMSGVLGNAPVQVGGFHLDEISVSVEITVKGELSILGTGVGVEGTGGMSFAFKRG